MITPQAVGSDGMPSSSSDSGASTEETADMKVCVCKMFSSLWLVMTTRKPAIVTASARQRWLEQWLWRVRMTQCMQSEQQLLSAWQAAAGHCIRHNSHCSCGAVTLRPAKTVCMSAGWSGSGIEWGHELRLGIAIWAFSCTVCIDQALTACCPVYLLTHAACSWLKDPRNWLPLTNG
jgi:hypothetical protein